MDVYPIYFLVMYPIEHVVFPSLEGSILFIFE